MHIDQFSILAAIGLSSAALAVTLFMSWVVGRSETYLLVWSIGLAVIVAGVVLFAGIPGYDPRAQLAAFVLLILGFGLIYAGVAQFCSGQWQRRRAAIASAIGLLLTIAAFVLGYSGTGTIAANWGIGLLVALAAYHYWIARAEAPLLMVSNATLYLLTAASFVACGGVLAAHGQFVLTARPENWAEEFNSVMVIIGLTGIGAMSLAIDQARIANRHRSEAMTDPLTGLLNRRALFGGLTGRVPDEVALVVLDLDHFKSINDRFGHASGDMVLRAFAEVISSNLRSSDVAARLGGEEFCILLPNAGPDAAARIAERIRAHLEAKVFPTPSGPIRSTVSAGIAARSAEPESFQALLNRADLALYQAKSSGRNRVHVSRLHLAA